VFTPHLPLVVYRAKSWNFSGKEVAENKCAGAGSLISANRLMGGGGIVVVVAWNSKVPTVSKSDKENVKGTSKNVLSNTKMLIGLKEKVGNIVRCKVGSPSAATTVLSCTVLVSHSPLYSPLHSVGKDRIHSSAEDGSRQGNVGDSCCCDTRGRLVLSVFCIRVAVGETGERNSAKCS
jgi:hypothetical protein